MKVIKLADFFVRRGGFYSREGIKMLGWGENREHIGRQRAFGVQVSCAKWSKPLCTWDSSCWQPVCLLLTARFRPKSGRSGVVFRTGFVRLCLRYVLLFPVRDLDSPSSSYEFFSERCSRFLKLYFSVLLLQLLNGAVLESLKLFGPSFLE